MGVQTVLQSDKDMSALLGSNSNFERWIKNGFSAEDLTSSSHDSEDILSQGVHPPPSPLLPLAVNCQRLMHKKRDCHA